MRRRSPIIAFIFAALFGLFDFGCSSREPMDTSVGDPAILAGSFQVRLDALSAAMGAAGHTSVIGKVYDGPQPPLMKWSEVLRDGDCRLLKPHIPFCAMPCTNGTVCIE